MADKFTWIDTYVAIANKLYTYRDRQDDLLAIFNELFNVDGSEGKFKFPGNGHGERVYKAIDPFTFFSTFNRGIASAGNDAKRQRILGRVIEQLGLNVPVPGDFAGVPLSFALKSWFFIGSDEAITGGDVQRLWDVFVAAIDYADSAEPDSSKREVFVQAYDAVKDQPLLKWNITYALFWIRPYVFPGFDSVNRTYLERNYGLKITNPPNGEEYLGLAERIKALVGVELPVFSDNAFVAGGWWPAKEIYDPGLTVDDWKTILADRDLVSENCLVTLSRLRLYGGEATCTELASRFGNDPQFYNSNINTAAGKIVRKQGCPAPPEREENARWWPVLCVGKHAPRKRPGRYIYKLRPELKQALASLDLPDSFSLGYDPAALRELIQHYKQDYYRFRGPENDHEAYKWDLVANYQEKWDIDSEDFKGMFAQAVGPAARGQGAILGNGWEYPYQRLQALMDYDEEKVREAFRLLQDPEKDLPEAYDDFTLAIDDLLNRRNAESDAPLDKSYQTAAAISVYLSFSQPGRYYLYKPSVGASLAKQLGVAMPKGSFEAFVAYEGLCDAILPVVLADADLVAMNDSVLTETQRAADPEHHLLVQDIAYYCSAYMGRWHEDAPVKENVVYPKNMILYGPPGTGKTYQTKAYAVAICEGKPVDAVLDEMRADGGYEAVSKRYKALEAAGRIGFTTFHQSYGYEEFIEGIRPEYDESLNAMTYPVRPGVFQRFCAEADGILAAARARGVVRYEDNPEPRVWKMGLKTAEVPDLFSVCRKDHCLRMGWDEVLPDDVSESDALSDANRRAILAFQEEMQKGDLVVVPGSDPGVYTIGVVTGDFEWRESLGAAKRYRSCRWLTDVGKSTFRKLNGGKALTLQTVYELTRFTAAQLLETVGLVDDTARQAEAEAGETPYVFIIDEINRGNISKVFGELITLIEESKRKGAPEAMAATLPYSGKPFAVPSNVYIIGTMNTADRSIALMDTALRRRFSFVEVMPDPSLLGDVKVDGVDVARMLEVMNARIELLYDREHTLGHAYFLALKDDPNVEALAGVFGRNIIPLLQEYFYDDYAKIRSVLGAAANDFIRVKDGSEIFWQDDEKSYGNLRSYSVVSQMPVEAAAYARIYQMEGEQ